MPRRGTIFFFPSAGKALERAPTEGRITSPARKAAARAECSSRDDYANRCMSFGTKLAERGAAPGEIETIARARPFLQPREKRQEDEKKEEEEKPTPRG